MNFTSSFSSKIWRLQCLFNNLVYFLKKVEIKWLQLYFVVALPNFSELFKLLGKNVKAIKETLQIPIETCFCKTFSYNIMKPDAVYFDSLDE